MEQPELKLDYIWDAGTAGFTHCDTMPAPQGFFKVYFIT